MKDLVIIVAVILCLMIIVSLVNNYYNVSEGLETKNTLPPVSPLTFADELSKNKDALVNGLNISANKATYEDILTSSGLLEKHNKDTLQEAKEYIDSQ